MKGYVAIFCEKKFSDLPRVIRFRELGMTNGLFVNGFQCEFELNLRFKRDQS